MPLMRITDRITQVGADDPGLHYFDCLMPTPYGTTYNSFLVDGDEKSALIDPVQEDTVDQLLANLQELEGKHLEYIFCLHAEQDHSGAAAILLDRYPRSQIVATAKVAEFLGIHLHIPQERILIVKEGDKIDLGGVSLECMPVPFAHWPDYTMYWMAEECVLFSSALFGRHYAPDIPSKPDEAIRLLRRQWQGLAGRLLPLLVPYAVRISSGSTSGVSHDTILGACLKPALIIHQPADGPAAAVSRERQRLLPDLTQISRLQAESRPFQEDSAYLAALTSFLKRYFLSGNSEKTTGVLSAGWKAAARPGSAQPG